jgi:hypothetical protein
MKFTEWLKRQAQNGEVDAFLKNAVAEKSWPHDADCLQDFVQHIKAKGASVDICGNLLRFWAKYLKVVSSVRPISAEEIREIREVLVSMLNWIRSSCTHLDEREERAMADAETQVACLEEKEIELRYANLQVRGG